MNNSTDKSNFITVDLSEVEHELSDQRETLDKAIYFFKVGTPVQEVKDWIQCTKNKQPVRSKYQLKEVKS